jgi:histidinol-phosphatase
MIDPVVESYDVGPMPVILAEAGGRFTDLAGGDRIDGGSGLGTNGAVHDALLQLLA